MLKHAGSTGEINMHLMFGLSLRGGMYMSGQIKADVYMKNRLHLRWGMYMIRLQMIGGGRQRKISLCYWMPRVV